MNSVNSAERARLIGINLKMYFGLAQTRDWVSEIRGIADDQHETVGVPEVFVLPSFPVLESVATLLGGGSVSWGAQDLAASPDRAQTGEVSGGMLKELGCRYVEVGHAERRRLFGETDAVVRAKIVEAFAHGLTPVLCVGEPARSDPRSAAEICVAQLRAARTRDDDRELVVVYEPVWAIGVDEPAPADHVRKVCAVLRDELLTRPGHSRLLYGGSAGPGTFAKLMPSVDGLFLGRFAHDPNNVRAILREVAATPIAGSSAMDVGANVSMNRKFSY